MADLCISCEKSCNNTYSISCGFCSKWVHKKCIGMPIDQFNYYAEQQKLTNGEKYKCSACLSNVTSNINPAKNKRKKTENDEELPGRENKWTINDVMEKLMEMDSRYTDLLCKYEKQEKVNNELRQQVLELQKQLNEEIGNREQRELKNNVIIKGIPQPEGRENMEETLKKVGVFLQVDVSKAKAFRLGKGGVRPAPIKVCFDSEYDKERLLMAKKRKRITNRDLGYNTNDQQFVFIDHDLTRKNQELYKETRLFRKENQYQFVWIKGGKIFLRKNENSKAIMVNSLEDLKN